MALASVENTATNADVQKEQAVREEKSAAVVPVPEALAAPVNNSRDFNEERNKKKPAVKSSDSLFSDDEY